jgi:hypothetical protein
MSRSEGPNGVEWSLLLPTGVVSMSLRRFASGLSDSSALGTTLHKSNDLSENGLCQFCRRSHTMASASEVYSDFERDLRK